MVGWVGCCWLLFFGFFVYFCFVCFFVVAILYHFEPCNKQWRKSVYISKVFIIIVHFKTKSTGNSKTPISLTSHLQNLRINCVRCKSLCFSMVLIVCLCRITRNTHTNSGVSLHIFMTANFVLCLYIVSKLVCFYCVNENQTNKTHNFMYIMWSFLFISSPLLYIYILCLTHSSQVLYKYSKRFMYHNKDT